MGEISTDMTSGAACQLCGCYFADPGSIDGDDIYIHGYPAVCWDCWKELTKEEKKLYTKAEVETL